MPADTWQVELRNYGSKCKTMLNDLQKSKDEHKASDA